MQKKVVKANKKVVKAGLVDMIKKGIGKFQNSMINKILDDIISGKTVGQQKELHEQSLINAYLLRDDLPPEIIEKYKKVFSDLPPKEGIESSEYKVEDELDRLLSSEDDFNMVKPGEMIPVEINFKYRETVGEEHFLEDESGTEYVATMDQFSGPSIGIVSGGPFEGFPVYKHDIK